MPPPLSSGGAGAAGAAGCESSPVGAGVAGPELSARTGAGGRAFESSAEPDAPDLPPPGDAATTGAAGTTPVDPGVGAIPPTA